MAGVGPKPGTLYSNSKFLVLHENLTFLSHKIVFLSSQGKADFLLGRLGISALKYYAFDLENKGTITEN